MHKHLIILVLLFSLTGCVNLKNEIYLDRIFLLKTKTLLIDGKEYYTISKGGIGFSPWINLPNVYIESGVLEHKIRHMDVLLLIDEKGNIEDVKIIRSTRINAIDKTAIEQIKKTGKSKSWIVNGKPVRFVVRQEFIFQPS
ncbi:energy transducer TonB [Acinetobacter courvalinii]|uniref:energy transducer TonB n=1 Tax=Acinetobacter courvalinii TaxID=280147 RepID=UPI0021D3BA48|nr:energy transducer TonB [Acinetobacter courvalinii]MCU4576115.1 energy transducer TonB [Acinetobacter courvalinii]